MITGIIFGVYLTVIGLVIMEIDDRREQKRERKEKEKAREVEK